jgi:ribosome-binding protein aMBF1 (putative translation factor)
MESNPRTVLAITRVLHNTKQNQLAAHVQYDATALSAVERRRRACPARVRQALAKYFEIPERRLFDEKGWAEEL